MDGDSQLRKLPFYENMLMQYKDFSSVTKMQLKKIDICPIHLQNKDFLIYALDQK